MRQLNYDLKQLCHRNRDGSYGTQADRLRILQLIAEQLHKAGFKDLRATGLKPKHVEALAQRWLADSLNAGTIKNRMAQLRFGPRRSASATSSRGTTPTTGSRSANSSAP